MMAHDLKIISYNVRGINNIRKRTAIFEYLKKQGGDIVFLQESYSSNEIENKWVQEWGGTGYFLHGTKHSKGIAILIRKNLNINILDIEKDKSNRILLLKIKIDERILYLINVYAPNKEAEQITFINAISRIITKYEINNGDNVIIGGDWNQVMNVNLDKCGGISHIVRQKYADKIAELMGTIDVLDIWRLRNSAKKRYTWRQKNPLIKCRLDYFLVSQHMQEHIIKTDILPAMLSDHSPITLSLKFIDTPSIGPGHWKLNVAVLEETDYKTKMREHLINMKKMYSGMENLNLQWELIKYEIRKFSIEYCKKRKKKMNEIRVAKEKELEKILSDESCNSVNTQVQIQTLQTQLEEIYLNEAEGAIIRSRAKWHEQGEKSTSYFFNLEKQRSANKNIKKIIKNGIEITNPTEILKEITDFYQNLYKNNDPPLQEENIFLSQNTIPKLDDTDQQSCEGTITLQECESVIKKFKKNKSPGNDGIPVEFYLEFWNEIKQPLINCYNYSFENGLLTTSQRQAIISLISKPGKDRTHIENWRPISLLNIDYKIMTKCLSERLAKIIDKIVHQSQFGFIKGRNINDALRTILDIVEYTDMENKPGILLALDFQKAFDSLSWDYLFKTLKAYNFGIDYLTWVKLCYTDISSCVTNYKYASPYFALQRGVRQGDPLSPYLFILALETLSMKIREDEHINGITVGDKAIKVITFADDTTAFAKNERDAKKMFRYIQYFEKLAGLKLNKSKSDGFWLGANKNSNFKPLGIAWKTCIKILGINISYNKQEAIKLNFQTKLIKIKQILSIWAQRDLTIYGKILLIKSFALSQILHISSILPVPDKFISDLEEIVYNFLWNGKQHKVKKHVIIQKYENGGQNMISIQDMITGQRLTWIQKYLRRNNSYWKDTMESILNIDYLDIFLQSNFCIPHRITEFYRTVLQCWKNTRNDNIKSSEVIKEQYIWYNQHIKFNPNKRYMHAYIDKGIDLQCFGIALTID
jgi:exonuclease III